MENHIDFVETELHIQHTPTKTKYSLTPYCRNTLKDYITTASFIQRTINKMTYLIFYYKKPSKYYNYFANSD